MKYEGRADTTKVDAPSGGSVIADDGADKPVVHRVTEINDRKYIQLRVSF
jgi:hypothetical protein